MILLSCFYISALILIVYVCPLCHISPVVSPQKEQEVNPVFLFCFFFIQNYIDTSNFVSPFCPLKATERVGDTVPDRLQVWPWGCWIQRARCHGDPLQRIRVQVRLWRPNRNMLGVNVFFFCHDSGELHVTPPLCRGVLSSHLKRRVSPFQGVATDFRHCYHGDHRSSQPALIGQGRDGRYDS